ncbi:transposable element Tcb1 transposase [Trichonephila clavipes]|nr:transposable element Tcb1 transposase [Trichonephila clavipes]
MLSTYENVSKAACPLPMDGTHQFAVYIMAWSQPYFNRVMRDHARIVQRFFVNHQIELLPWPARPPDLSPIENMWSMVAQRLTQIIPPAATPDQL